MRKNRVSNDFYPTGDRLTEALKSRVLIQGSVLEPCAGDNAIAKHFPGCITNELHPQPDSEPNYNLDASIPMSWLLLPETDWIVTNPPFKEAHLIIPYALVKAKVGIAFLLRLSYLEPTNNRAQWLDANSDCLKHLIVVSPRPKFRSDTQGSDSVTVAWFVWEKAWSWKSLGIPCPFAFARLNEEKPCTESSSNFDDKPKKSLSDLQKMLGTDKPALTQGRTEDDWNNLLKN